MILLIDNYDSFSYNLFQLIGEVDSDINVVRNDKITAEEIDELDPSCIILSPGPENLKMQGFVLKWFRSFMIKFQF